MARVKKGPTPKEGAPDWIVTYGDMMTLLMTFFVLILSFSAIKMDEFKAAMGSLQAALGVLKGQQMIMAVPSESIMLPSNVELMKVAQQIKDNLQEAGMAGLVEMELSGDGVRFKMNSLLLFDLGKADLKDEAMPVLDNIAYLINKFGSSAIIEGHTDDIPISNIDFKSNWELSAARGTAVVEYFLSLPDAEPEIYSVAAFSEYRPLVPNTSSENRARNRRVEIMIKLKNPPGIFSEQEIDLLLEYVEPSVDEPPAISDESKDGTVPEQAGDFEERPAGVNPDGTADTTEIK